jgi:signal transduction histidine kinase
MWNRRGRGRTLRATSLALLGGYALFLSATYGGFTLFLLRRETAAARERLHQTAQLVAAEIDVHLDAGKQRLATVAQLPGLVYGLHRMQEAEGKGYIPPWTTLHYLFFKSPVFTGGVFLLDRASKVIWTEPPGLPSLGTSLADHPAIAAMQKETPAPVSVGLPSDELLAVPHVLIGFPITDQEGEVTGLLAGVIDLTATGFTGIRQAISTADGRYLSVLDQTGRVISSTDPSQLLARGPTVPADAGEAPLASAPLVQAPWHVVAGEPEEAAHAPIRQLQRMLIGMGALMLILAIAMGSRFMRRFVGAIQRLTRAAEVMASGDLSQPIVVDDRQLELAMLGRTFERMRLELRRSQAALTERLAERDELIRLKEEFLANVSHELRTPLNVIFGYNDMLLEIEEDPERRDLLDRIRGQSGQLQQLVGDLMTLSGLNAGKLSLELGPVNLVDVLDRIRTVGARLADGRPVVFLCEYASSMPIMHADPLRLEQVLTNLLTNAFKFTTQGSVALRVRHDATTTRVIFEVADTGIGIAAAELPHIFDEFRQVDGSMSRRHGGMGLGLALVRRLVALLGGDVTVASRPGEGSTFTVALPIGQPSAALGADRAA